MRHISTLVIMVLAVTAANAQVGVHRDGVAAVANDKVITRLDIETDLAKRKIDVSKLSESDREAIFQQALVEKLLDILTEQATKKAGIAVSEEDLIERRAAHIEQRYGSQEAFSEHLADRGISEKEWNENFRSDQETQTWLAIATGRAGATSREARPRFDLSVTPQELRDHYRKNKETIFTQTEAVKLRVIQMYYRRSPAQDRIRKRQALLGLKAKLATKADFAVLAEKNNEHAASKDKQGDIGWVEKETDAVPERLLGFVFDPKSVAGTVIGPVESGNSFWLVKVEERREARVVPFSEAQRRCRYELRIKKHQRALATVLLELVDESYIYPSRLKRHVEDTLHRKLRPMQP